MLKLAPLTVICGYSLPSKELLSAFVENRIFIEYCPEAFNHIREQIRLAKDYVELINNGALILLATYSIEIIRELNTLIMLHNKADMDYIKDIMKKYHYKNTELLNPNKLACYEYDGTKFIKTNIDPYLGMSISCFDETIETINNIQDEIEFGDNKL